jgi:hypothetical protein
MQILTLSNMLIRFNTSMAQSILQGYSKLALSEYNKAYLSATAFIVFMLH